MNDTSNTPVTADAATQLKQLAESLLERRAYIENALAYAEGTHTFDDIVHMVATGRLMWWPLPRGFMVTEIVEYPRTKHLNVFLAGGDLDEIRATQEQLVLVAKLSGCTALSLSGRRGWVKALTQLGWKESHTAVVFNIPAQNSTEQVDG